MPEKKITISILMTSCDHHIAYGFQALKSLKQANNFIIFGYDKKEENVPKSIIDLCDIYFQKPEWEGKQKGELYLLKKGLDYAVKTSEYVLQISSDTAINKPEGIRDLPTLLGDNDAIFGQWGSKICIERDHYELVGTLIFFGKTDVLFDIFKDLSIAKKQKIEQVVSDEITKKTIKYKVHPLLDGRGARGKNGVWNELLDYHHLHAEKAFREKFTPPRYDDVYYEGMKILNQS